MPTITVLWAFGSYVMLLRGCHRASSIKCGRRLLAHTNDKSKKLTELELGRQLKLGICVISEPLSDSGGSWARRPHISRLESFGCHLCCASLAITMPRKTDEDSMHHRLLEHT
jgi:hypothetical protein